MKETVTIVATETVRKLAQKAMDIQNASNPRGVHTFLGEVMTHFSQTDNGQKYTGSAMAGQNPVTIAVLNKLNDLARSTQGRTDSFVVCMDLADGKDCEWEVDLN
jgi:hypothetical protein